jgi:hypothetical protein
MDYDIVRELERLLFWVKECKPNDGSDIDRRYAIFITELEKVYAYFVTYVR